MKKGFSWLTLIIALFTLIIGSLGTTVFLTQTGAGNTIYTSMGGTCPTCPTKTCPPWNGVCTYPIVNQCCEEEGGKPLPKETCSSVVPNSDLDAYNTPYTDIENEVIDACDAGTCVTAGTCQPSVDADGYFEKCVCK